MVQIAKSLLLAWIFFAETRAFLPTSAKVSPRIDSSKWRLEQYNIPATYGGRIRSSNGTDAAFVVDTSSYHQSVTSEQLEESSVAIDSVDMSHYQSSFRGLTAPSQAGLVLSLLISLAMVVSSPDIDTSFITSELTSLTQLMDESSLREFSTAWGADMNQDLLPTGLINKLNLLASDLSLQGDNMLQQAREQTETWQSNSALAYQSFQELMTTVSGKSMAWQDAFATESSKWQEQAVSTMDQWQVMVASKMMEAQVVAADVSAKGSKMMENAVLQATTFRDVVTNSLTRGQTTVEGTVQQIQTLVATRLDETSAQLHESMEGFRKTADESMLREAPILKAESLQWKSQHVDPIVLASHELWTSFNVELDRESSVASQAALQSISWLQTFWEAKFAQMQDMPWREASRDVESWNVELKAALSETVAKLQTDFASKATEVRDVDIPNAQKALQLSLENLFQLVELRITELQASISSAYLAAQEQANANLARWKEITDTQIAADQVALTQFYEDVTLKCESTMAQVSDFRNLMASQLDQNKEDFELFKKNADVKMLAEGAVLKEQVMKAQEQVRAFFDTGLGKVAGPMAVFQQGWNTLLDVDIPHIQDVVATESSKLYLSFMSHARPLQDSLTSNYGVAVNQIIPSAKDAIRESVDFARTETQSFASTAKDMTESVITQARSSGLAVTDQVSDAVSTMTSKADIKVDVLPATKPVVDSVKLADTPVSALRQQDVSSESLSSLYDRLQDQLLKST